MSRLVTVRTTATAPPRPPSSKSKLAVTLKRDRGTIARYYAIAWKLLPDFREEIKFQKRASPSTPLPRLPITPYQAWVIQEISELSKQVQALGQPGSAIRSEVARRANRLNYLSFVEKKRNA